MKLTFAAEDCVIGAICGLLLLMYAGKIYPLKLNPYVYAVIFAILIIFIFFDVIHEFSDLSTHPFFILFSILHSLVDLALALAFISFFAQVNIPYVTTMLVPLISETSIYYAGIFMVVANVLWIIFLPFVY